MKNSQNIHVYNIECFSTWSEFCPSSHSYSLVVSYDHHHFYHGKLHFSQWKFNMGTFGMKNLRSPKSGSFRDSDSRKTWGDCESMVFTWIIWEGTKLCIGSNGCAGKWLFPWKWLFLLPISQPPTANTCLNASSFNPRGSIDTNMKDACPS